MPDARLSYCIVFFIWIFCFIYNPCLSQHEPHYFVLNKQNGLQSNKIYATHINRNGLLYLAHAKGLSSFDGMVFKNYYNKSLPFTEVTNIMETEDGSIFCKAFNNNLYRVVNDSLISEKWFSHPMGFSPSSAYKNTIIALIKDSVALYNSLNKTSKTLAISSLPELRHFEDIVFCGISYVGKEGYIVYVNKQFQCYKTNIQSSSLGKLHMHFGEAYSVVDHRVEHIERLKNKEQINIQATHPNTFVNYITTIKGTRWFCTTDGLYYYDTLKGPSSAKHMLSGFSVTNIVQTFDQIYIVSTLDDGLVLIPDERVRKFSGIPSPLAKLTGYRNNLLGSSLSGEVYSYNLTSQQLSRKQQSVGSKIPALALYDTLSETLITSDKKTTFRNTQFNFEEPYIVKDYCYTAKGMLLATSNGLYYLSMNSFKPWWLTKSPSSATFHPYLHLLAYFKEPVFTVKYDATQDVIYCNTYDGILTITAKDSIPQLLPEPYCVLSDMAVYQGRILLFTKDKNILEWNGKQYVPAFNGKAPQGIFNKAEIIHDQLWVYANDALYAFNGASWKRFDQRYGIMPEDVNGIYTLENEVYINNQDQVIHFPIQLAELKKQTPRFLLGSCINTVNNRFILPFAKLPYQHNSLVIHFNLISYLNGRNTHLAYSINQEDPIHLPSNSREIQLNHLSPNTYTIQFFLSEDQHIPPTAVGRFTFTIKPPFYKTWWFTLSLLLCAILIMASISRRILFRYKKEARLIQGKLILEKELDKSILSGIKAQMNPHFVFNALNTIQSYIYMNDKKNASMYISKFSDLTRSILDMSTKDTIPLEEEIKSLNLYLDLEKMRFEDTFDFFIHLDPTIRTESVRIPAMLIQPYVENAIKHGLLHKKNNRILHLYFQKVEQQLEIIIDDNGIGRKRSGELHAIKQKQHQSFAMEANKKRLDILKNNFKDIHFEIIDKYSPLGEAIGTKVIIRLPL